jgi:hypothetical protein
MSLDALVVGQDVELTRLYRRFFDKLWLSAAAQDCELPRGGGGPSGPWVK